MPYTKVRISIPNVTGNIVITATAAQSASSYTNLIPTSEPYNADYNNGYRLNYRLNSSGTETAAQGCIVSGYIPYTYTAGDVIRVTGAKVGGQPSWTGQYIALYDNTKAKLHVISAYNFAGMNWELNESTNTTGFTMVTANCSDQVKNYLANTAFIRVGLAVNTSVVLTDSNAEKFICTINEVIE